MSQHFDSTLVFDQLDLDLIIKVINHTLLSSSGIGALLANTLAVRNVTVVVLDVNPIVTENYNITYYKCDVSKWEEVEAVAKEIVDDLGHPTILVNNAGVVQGKNLVDLTVADVEQTFGTNVSSHFWTLKAFLPQMIKEKKGHILTVSSVMGLAGAAQMTDYCASKAALLGLHESLRYELDHVYNAPAVRTTLLCPGHVMTPLFSTVKFPSSWWYRFFAPSLAPHDVVKAMIAAMDEQESRTIFMPFYTHFVRLTGILPSWARDFCQWISQADYAMRDFVKVTGRRADEPPLSKQ
ncbi:Short-chain dehydrogenase/reductase family protein [Ceratobasidium theobromae]|uniref:Short-chain dehydrogenase/reductase 3 n=1 Tax=Ceratobasidium theobromae TaxID=1582974 RepID=A0A5N5QFK6_9AGAM|nr:Short-chain dehydrogenase/reductase family protein [Ceratobasidium theobromae]